MKKMLASEIAKSQALKDFITVTREYIGAPCVDTSALVKRRRKFADKILLQTGSIEFSQEIALQVVLDILSVIDTGLLADSCWF